MRRKKILSLIVASVLSLTILTACGKKEEPKPADNKPAAGASALKDGKYRAEYDKEDTKGWKAFTEIEVKGGKVVSAKYDYVKPDGSLKSQDKAYNDAMKAKSGTNPAEYTVKLANALVEKQDATKVDKVTGATHSWEYFKEMADKLIKEKASKGDTAKLVLPQPDVLTLKDGKYKAEFDKEDTRGWKSFVEIEVKGGKITAAKFDDVKADGSLKSQDKAYNDSMKKSSPTNPADYTVKLAKALVEKQNSNVDVVTGATSSSNNFKTLASKLLTDKAAKGDATTLVLPQPDVKK